MEFRRLERLGDHGEVMVWEGSTQVSRQASIGLDRNHPARPVCQQQPGREARARADLEYVNAGPKTGALTQRLPGCLGVRRSRAVVVRRITAERLATE